MKPRTPFSHLAAVLFLFAALAEFSCSVIGYGVGSTIDSQTVKDVQVSSWEVHRLQPGTYVTILMRDGMTLKGRFEGLSNVPSKEYVRRFEKSRKGWPAATSAPSLTDTVTISLLGWHSGDFELVGYDANGVMVKPFGPEPPRLFAYKHFDTVRVGPRAYTPDDLKKLVPTLKLPLLTAIEIEFLGSSHYIDPGEVQTISFAQGGGAAAAGLVLGLAVDAIVIAVAISSTKHTHPVTTQSGSSCPLVYSFDGSEYTLDSETFGGAITKSLQRTDFDNLEHLSDDGGICRLRITNDLPETEYIDAFSLLAVDHPASSIVIPSFDGRLRTISCQTHPSNAVDLTNTNVLPLLRSQDDQWWMSNPFNRDPEGTNDTRDGIILSFARPSGTRTVKLAMVVQNTPWATEIEGQLLRLQGTDLGRWYNAMDSEREYQEAFVDVVKREAMLALSVWNGKSWVPGGHVSFVGPYIHKAQVVELNIADIPGDVLRLRMESTAGLWMVNSVTADFSPDLPMTIQEVYASSAVDGAGADISASLRSIDGNYFVLPRNGQAANVNFNPPSRERNMSRTYILKCSGYYIMDIQAEGTPQRSLLRTLAAEPGAFGRYSLYILNNFASAHMHRLAMEPGSR